MTTLSSPNVAPGSRGSRSEVVVSVELLPGGCRLYRLQWPDRKPD